MDRRELLRSLIVIPGLRLLPLSHSLPKSTYNHLNAVDRAAAVAEAIRRGWEYTWKSGGPTPSYRYSLYWMMRHPKIKKQWGQGVYLSGASAGVLANAIDLLEYNRAEVTAKLLSKGDLDVEGGS